MTAVNEYEVHRFPIRAIIVRGGIAFKAHYLLIETRFFILVAGLDLTGELRVIGVMRCGE